MKIMRRKVILFGLIFIVLLIIGCVQKKNGDINIQQNVPTEDFLIKYTREYDYRGEHRIEIIMISPKGEVYPDKTLLNGEVPIDPSIKINGSKLKVKIPDSELKEFINFVVKDKDFFNLPSNLTGKGCSEGASTEDLEVKLDGESHKIGGYCVEDNSFIEIYYRLTGLISSNTPATFIPGE